MSRTKKFLTRVKEELWNPEMRVAYAVGALVGLTVAARLINLKVEAVSATQDEILKTLEEADIIQNLHLGD